MPGVLPGRVCQQGYVVADLDSTIDHWWRVLGIGPWFTVSELKLDPCEFRGEPAVIEIGLAVANSGDLQIEMIEPHGGSPSCYSEFLASGPPGLHHLAWWTEHFDATIERASAAGWEAIQSGDAMGTRFCYFENGAPRGAVAELMELNDMSRWFVEIARDASRDWDGVSDPVRSLG